MHNIFSTVRSSVTARQAAELYGISVNRSGMACCPFHEDRHPSMKVDERYYCFGCHETGSVIDLTAKLFGLTPYEAALKLAGDFHLDANTPAPVSAGPTKWQLQRQERDIEARCIRVLTDYERMLKQKQEEYAPSADDQDWDPRYQEVSRQLPGISYFLDLMYQPDAQERKDTAEALIRSGAIKRLEDELEREQKESA